MWSSFSWAGFTGEGALVIRSWARCVLGKAITSRMDCAPEPETVAQLFRHRVLRMLLGLPSSAPSLRAPPDAPDGLAADPPREWAYEPVLEDLPIPDPAMA